MKQCKIKNCIGKHYAKGYCRSHYRKIVNQDSKKRWFRIKGDKNLYAKLKKAQNKWRNKVKGEEWFKEGNRIRQKRRYYTNIERRNYLVEWRNQQEFGGLREEIIKRDGNKCTECGMTREEHRLKYGKDIIVHHNDNKGRMVKRDEKNNTKDNLRTVCFGCHMILHRV